MSSPQSEVFEDVDFDMFTPTEFEFPITPIDAVKAMYPEILKACLEIELKTNPPPEPLTDEFREKRMEELALICPMPSEDLPLEQQWWVTLPSYQQPPALPAYTCDPANENSLCSLGLCGVCSPQPDLADMADMNVVDVVEVVEDDASGFPEILASFGVTVLRKPAVEEEMAFLWGDNPNWITLAD